MHTGKLFRVFILLAQIAFCTTAKAQLSANFTATPRSGCSPLVVSFTDSSTGNPTSWRWDLGNGTTSILRNPSVIYFTPGTYTVKLVVANASGRDSVVKTDFIEVNAKPTVNFGVSSSTGCYPLPVQFTDSSIAGSGTLESWIWDFGDGSTSTEQNPTHSYNSARNFNVTLQVKNSNGCVTTVTKNAMIRISSGVIADFSNDNTQTCSAPVTINFHDQSIGTGALSYQWDFGDNTTSTLAHPSHTYTRSGSFTVRLIVSNAVGCTDTITKVNAIVVGSVRAGFTAPDSVCLGAAMQFTNTSNPAPASVMWNFGDDSSSVLLNPGKTYATAGTYTVKMVANFGACLDSFSKTITVIQTPNVSFAADATGSCKIPFTVNFNNTSTNASSYNWNFGGTNTSSATSPSFIFNAFGNYTIKLTATGEFGCTKTLTKTDYINIARLSIRPSNFPDSACVPFTKTFGITVNSTDPIASYFWNLGNGVTDTVATPTNTYTVDGTYNVSVIVVTAGGCTDTARINRAIIASDKPTANFSATPRVTCAKMSIQFTDLSTGGATKWFWEFGDGTTSTQRNPIKQYQDTGLFTVKLKIWRGGCVDSITFDDYIQINPPIAKFTVGFSCSRPFERVMTNQSIGADEWQWDFGDGTTDNTQNPAHQYTSPGLYTITLKVTNRQTGCDHSTTFPVRVLRTTASFSASDTILCRGASTTFSTSISPADLNSIKWSFGDGTPDVVTGLNVTSINHTYATRGLFTVTMISRNKNNCNDTIRKIAYIKVDGPTAKFGANVPGACANSNVSFSDSSITDGSNAIVQWDWNYGDSTSEVLTAGPFQHFFQQSGLYTVSLKVTDAKGCTDSTSLAAPLIISKPTPAFTSIDTNSCPGKIIRFSNRSSGTIVHTTWDFGDGDTLASTGNASHVYQQDGLYTIKLTAHDSYGCIDSLIKTAYIKISSPMANFTVSDTIGNCPPLIATFTNRSGSAISRKWDFGDSTYSTENNPVHFYNLPGVYFASLTITVAGGCTNTFTQRIVVKGPEGTFSYSPLTGCSPLTVSFAANTTNIRNSFIWDFNDGSTLSTADSFASHVYTYAGRFVPKMILVDPAGCKVPLPGTDTIVITGIGAKFGIDKTIVCDSGIVSFSDSSYGVNDAVTSYTWNFGDGTFSSLQNPTHQFSTPGIYYPSLIARGRTGCDDTIRAVIPIRIVHSPKIAISSTANGCTPLSVTLNSQLLTTDTSSIEWRWRLPNNVILSTTPPVQQYTTAGLYTISLTGTNSSGCRDSVSRIVEAYAIPAVNAGEDKLLCEGSGLTLQASGAATYAWSPATSLTCANCPNPITNSNADILYTVTGTSVNGCVASDSVAINVKKKFTFRYGNGDSVCKGQSRTLSASGAQNYQWSPSNGLSSTNTASTVATPPVTTQYRVIGSDDAGCFSDTGFITVKVHPIPTVEAGNDITVNAGNTVDLVPRISSDVTFVNWQPTAGQFRNSFPGITVKPETNTEYTVEVKNRGGCTARDRVTVFVICNGSNLFVPNTFSPNGDGINDYFYPRGTGLFRIKEMRIYTRWGELLYDRGDFAANLSSFGWDGTKRGKKLDPDVFVYTLEVICDNGNIIIYRGNIALVK